MSKAFVVLGMHRSGTSLISKSLRHEISIGDRVITQVTKGHLYGHYENEDFVELNKKILKSAGGDEFLNIPPEGAILSQAKRFKSEIEKTVKKNSKGHDIWGWKDPRTTLTAKLYLPYLEDSHFVCIFRKPSEVVKNFYKRHLTNTDNHPIYTISQIQAMAREYNSRLMKFIAEFLETEQIELCER